MNHLRDGGPGPAPGCGQAAAVTVGLPDLAGHGMVTAPGSPGGRPDSSVEQMQYVFHELHADGRHALCAICM
jgi:hypothetical protein